MSIVGRFHKLKVNRIVDFGAYLECEDADEILVPNKYIEKEVEIGDYLDVFVYRDSEDRLIATTETPIATANQIAFLECSAVTKFGAFLNWGLLKDLFVPFREQKQKLEEGKKYLVYIYVDEETDRIVASTKLQKFINNDELDLEEGEEVELIVAGISELGYKVIVDKEYWGLLYKNEVFQKVRVGDNLTGFVSKIREDNKVDIKLKKATHFKETISETTQELLDKITEEGGVLYLTDKSSPDEIYSVMKMSKRNFKNAVGALYKQKIIILEKNCIKLANK